MSFFIVFPLLVRILFEPTIFGCYGTHDGLVALVFQTLDIFMPSGEGVDGLMDSEF